MSVHPLDFFERVFVINLEYRKDRRQAMERELVRIGYDPDKVYWFKAFRPETPEPFYSVGMHGVFLSHLGVLSKACELGLHKCLILEDDAKFSSDFQAQAATVVNDLGTCAWDVFYGGYSIDDTPSTKGPITELPSSTPLLLAHCVAFNDTTILRVRDYISQQPSRAKGDPAGGPMMIDGSYSWARKDLDLRTFIATPQICVQRPSSSDITPKNWFDRLPLVRELANTVRRLKE